MIELLIVIAIVAILAVVVLLTLNPAQLLKQARDSNRVSDMATYKSAIALYLSDATTPDMNKGQNCSAHSSSTLATCNQPPASGEPARFSNAGVATTTALTVVTGTGWIPINFSVISSGAPISIEPIDPVNNPTYFYAYAASSTNLTYEVNVRMESAKFRQGGSADVESTDGGSTPALYEIGIIPGLNL